MEPHGHHPDSESTPPVDMDRLVEQAHELNAATFYDRIEQLKESNPELASDLQLAVRVAELARVEGGEALAVGGFARDDALARLRGQPVVSKDIDLEVYGIEYARLKELLLGLGQVKEAGDHFAVAKLINPETGHDLDISIPRRDSKTGAGHKGFEITGDPSMSVREAARRRDLTINALALNPITGELHDDFGGLEDLKRGVLRATDLELFADDPLRVLRVMQFAGRFNFSVDPPTAELCRSVDLAELPRERIGEEWDKLMLRSERPSVGLELARDLGILKKLHPDLEVLSQIEQEPEWHPEGNVWNHTKLVADAAARIVRDEGLTGDDALVVMYGALCHDLGKATTTKRTESHGRTRITAKGHDQAGATPTKRFLREIYLSNAVEAKILAVVQEHMFHTGVANPSDAAIRRLAWRLQPASIRLYNLVSRADSNGRGREWNPATPSQPIFEQAVALHVSEKPLERVVQGTQAGEVLGIEKGLAMGRAVEVLFERQMDGAFADLEGALAYAREHREELRAETQRRLEAYVAKRAAMAKQRKEEGVVRKLEAKRLRREAHLQRIAEREQRPH